MDLDDTPEQAAYRAQVRSWLEEHKARSAAAADTAADALAGRGGDTSPRAAPGRASSPRAGSPA